MTQTLEPTTGTEPSAARTRVETWLADFEAALAARDVDRAAGLFATTSFWRDLIAFTWNLTTVENRDGVADLLRQTMESTGATNFRITEGEEPEEADGVVTAWFRFETAVGRGSGLLRLNDEGAWTFLTTLDELKGDAAHLEAFRMYLADADYATICRKTELTEAAAKTAVHRLKGQLRDIVTGHLRETVANEEDLEVEVAEFLALLR